MEKCVRCGKPLVVGISQGVKGGGRAHARCVSEGTRRRG